MKGPEYSLSNVSRNGKTETVQAINLLNKMMFSEDKSTQDQEIVEWQMICGMAFRLVPPDETNEEDEAPFEMYTLDPRDSFVVCSNQIDRNPPMEVKFCINGTVPEELIRSTQKITIGKSKTRTFLN